jgi:hypothetical protein
MMMHRVVAGLKDLYAARSAVIRTVNQHELGRLF